MTVCSREEIIGLSNAVTHITVSNNCGNDQSLTMLDMSRFAYLREFVVGDECFFYVNELKLIGLNRLVKVVIGKKSFTKKNYSSSDPNRHFYLKACPKIREWRVDMYSFSDYTVCEIENVDALEVIEMGDLNERTSNFVSASLELKSILIHNE